VRQARRCTTVLVAVAATAGLMSSVGLAASGQLRGLSAMALLVCVGALGLALDVVRRGLDGAAHEVKRLAGECEAARRASLTDALTGLGNRRHFEQRLGEAVNSAVRYGEPFSVVLFDLDDFKRVNDRVGHAAGDGALRHVAAVLAAGSREHDVACRWGGEEFALLLPRTSAVDAARAAGRVVRSLRATVVDLGGAELRLTASAGVAAYPYDGPDGPTVVAAADVALLRAKALGKDQVRRARPVVVDLTGRERTPHATA
jgi:diguanylate cyclase (GGDEF)-like protein